MRSRAVNTATCSRPLDLLGDPIYPGLSVAWDPDPVDRTRIARPSGLPRRDDEANPSNAIEVPCDRRPIPGGTKALENELAEAILQLRVPAVEHGNAHRLALRARCLAGHLSDLATTHENRTPPTHAGPSGLG